MVIFEISISFCFTLVDCFFSFACFYFWKTLSFYSFSVLFLRNINGFLLFFHQPDPHKVVNTHRDMLSYLRSKYFSLHFYLSIPFFVKK